MLRIIWHAPTIIREICTLHLCDGTSAQMARIYSHFGDAILILFSARNSLYLFNNTISECYFQMLMYVIPRHAKIMQIARIILTSSTPLTAHAKQDIQENCVRQVK